MVTLLTDLRTNDSTGVVLLNHAQLPVRMDDNESSVFCSVRASEEP